jgi:hypothetical protein
VRKETGARRKKKGKRRRETNKRREKIYRRKKEIPERRQKTSGEIRGCNVEGRMEKRDGRRECRGEKGNKIR